MKLLMFSEAAARDYFEISTEQCWQRIISPHKLAYRLRVLNTVTHLSFLNKSLDFCEQENHIIWGLVEKSDRNLQDSLMNDGGAEGNSGKSSSNGKPNVAHFQSSDPDLSAWFFRPGDPDPYPSVPHGHWFNKSQPKLDPYTGRAYVNKKVKWDNSLKKKQFIALWNEDKFRASVKKSVEAYGSMHPTWKAATKIPDKGSKMPK